jgi:hypothetical protein
MIKLSKAYVLILVALTLPVLACTATAAFSFSVPSLSITAGPGLGSGPTVFNTYSHDVTTVGSGAASCAEANALSTPSWGQSCGVPCGGCGGCGGCDGFGGCGGWGGWGGWGGCGVPCGFGPFFGPSCIEACPSAADQAFNQQCGRQALEDNTFATSFYTAGVGPFSGLCNACISGNAPQQFTLQFF